MPYCHIGWLLDLWLKATEVIMFRRPCLLSLLFPSLYVTVLYDRVYADSERKREKPGPALWLSCNWSIAGSTVVQRGSVWWAWEYLTALKKEPKKKKRHEVQNFTNTELSSSCSLDLLPVHSCSMSSWCGTSTCTPLVWPLQSIRVHCTLHWAI